MTPWFQTTNQYTIQWVYPLYPMGLFPMNPYDPMALSSMNPYDPMGLSPINPYDPMGLSVYPL